MKRRRKPRVVVVQRRGPGLVWTIVGLLLIPILLFILLIYTGVLGLLFAVS